MEQTAPDVPAILGHATERLEVATGTFLPDVREVAVEANDQRNGVVDDAVGGLPAESKHAAALCADGVKVLLKRSVER